MGKGTVHGTHLESYSQALLDRVWYRCTPSGAGNVCSLLRFVHFFEKPYTAVLGESAYVLFYLTRYSFHMLVSRELVHIYIF